MRSVIAAALVLLLPACGGNEDVPESEGVFATVTLHLCLAYNGDTALDALVLAADDALVALGDPRLECLT